MDTLKVRDMLDPLGTLPRRVADRVHGILPDKPTGLEVSLMEAGGLWYCGLYEADENGILEPLSAGKGRTRPEAARDAVEQIEKGNLRWTLRV